MTRRYLDISLPLSAATPVWPGDPPVDLERVSDVALGDASTLTRLSISCHAGTHVDAPLHFVRDGADVADLDLTALMGPVWVADCTASAPYREPSGAIGPQVLKRLGLPDRALRLLLRTSDLPLADRDSSGQLAGLSPAGAAWLVDRGFLLIGIDTLSVADRAAIASVHRALLSAGIVILEGLDLHLAAPGLYELVCLPLRLVGAEGAPARAVLVTAGTQDR